MPRARLVKLAFLYAYDGVRKPPAASAYQFLPGRRGPYSFTLRRELRKLAGGGFLRVLPGRELSLPGADVPASAALPGGLLRLVRDFSWVYGRLTPAEMDKLIYGSHSRFTHEGALLLDLWAFRPPVKYAVYTAGCAGWQVDGFLDLLLRHGIRSLVDVRADPASRRYGFDRVTLSRICRQMGIRCAHLAQLSMPPAPDPGGDLERFPGRHPRCIPRNEAAVLADLSGMITRTPTVLMGSEADPRLCRRSRLAEALSRMTGLEERELGRPG